MSDQSKAASPEAGAPPTSSAAVSPSPSAPAIQFPVFATPTLPPGYPPLFTYPPPADGSQSEGTPSTLPYPLLYPPPGMVYAFPQRLPPAISAAGPGTSASAAKPKRSQVKMACTNCAAACKRCDEARPCERCKKYGIADSCVNSQRKERKKGIKRGPYKRKNKSSDEGESAQPSSEVGDWSQGSLSSNTAATPPPPPPQPAAQFPSEGGFYPIFIPPGYPLAEPQPNVDGSVPPGPTLLPIYIGGFAPYGFPSGAVFQLPPLGTHPPQPPVSQPPTAEAGTVPTADKSLEGLSGAQKNSPPDMVPSVALENAAFVTNNVADATQADEGKSFSEEVKDNDMLLANE